MSNSRVPASLDPALTPLPPPRKLSAEIESLIETFSSKPVALREVIAALPHRAYDLLLVLLPLPFLLPVSIPGMSAPFGLMVSIIAARRVIARQPWLPARLLDLKLPPRFFPRVLGAARRLVRWLEVLLRPRLPWLTASPRLTQLHAVVILVSGFILLLPLPPGSNFPPALCICIMGAGLLERDGLFILGGYFAFAVNLACFALFVFYGAKLFERAWSALPM